MKRSLLNHLRYPRCGGTLDLRVISESDESQAIETGVLVCVSECSWYPIINFVPVLLDFPGPSLPRVQGTPRGERHRTAAPERHTSKGGIGYPTKLHR